jgi:hypothetical protein
VRQSVFDQRHTNKIFLGGFDGFLDRQWNFSSFASAKTNVATFITDDDESSERKVLTTFNYFRDAID